jgi:serine/threonine protein kinase
MTLALIGAGDLGEVYEARETKLDREVVIKVLPSALAQDLERLARFEREAKVLASLSHPNIAQIHAIEEVGGIRALVMELVLARLWPAPSRLHSRWRPLLTTPSRLAKHWKPCTKRHYPPAT